MKMILDLDTGIDDALAMTYALGFPQVDLIGITTVFGNVTIDNAVKNSINILDLLGRHDVPVFKGASYPWNTTRYAPPADLLHVHGVNGIGNVDLGKAKRQPATQSAVDFLIASAHQHADDLILVATGPLTNLAEAIQKDRAAMHKIGKIVIMGGALTVPGNVTQYAEANFANDPHAAKYVMESGINITLVGLDVTLKTMITGNDIRSWGKLATKAAKVITELATYYYTNEYDNSDMGGAMHDPLAVEVALNPDIITHLLPINLTIETDALSSGRLIGHLERLTHNKKSTFIALDVDSETFINKFTRVVFNVLTSTE